jgi:hypothetical protein
MAAQIDAGPLLNKRQYCMKYYINREDTYNRRCDGIIAANEETAAHLSSLNIWMQSRIQSLEEL